MWCWFSQEVRSDDVDLEISVLTFPKGSKMHYWPSQGAYTYEVGFPKGLEITVLALPLGSKLPGWPSRGLKVAIVTFPKGLKLLCWPS